MRAHRWKTPAEGEELLRRLVAIRGLTPDQAAVFLIDGEAAVRAAGQSILRSLPKDEAAEAILTALTRQSEQGRRKIFESYVALFGGSLEMEQLDVLCRDYRPSVVSSVLDWLGAAPDPKFARLLDSPLESGSAALRRRSINVLERINSPSIARVAARVADDEDEEVRAGAIRILARYPSGEHVPALLKALGDSSPKIQETAAAGLKPLLASGDLAWPSLVMPLLSDVNSRVRGVAARLLQQQDPDRVVQAFIASFKNVFGAARDRGVAGSRELGPRFMMALAARARESDTEAANLAASIAVTLRSPEIVPLLIYLLTQPDWWLRHRAAEALAEIRDERALPALIQLLDDPDSNLSAAAALGTWGSPKGLGGLLEAYKKGAMDLRLEILEAFSKIPDSRVPALLQNIVKVDPEPVVREKAIRLGQTFHGHATVDTAAAWEQKFEPIDLASKSNLSLEDLLRHARAMDASDLHIAVNGVPHLRIHGAMTPLHVQPLDSEAVQKMIDPILTDAMRSSLAGTRHADFCYKAGALGRFRTNVFHQRKGVDAVFRLIPAEVPSLEEIGLPESVWELADYSQGLILVTGSAGSGKTTTLAAMVERINRTQTCHILTIEDPIEYLHRSKECLITQREIPAHSESFAKALRQAFREDPDVIMVGEMRDLETISLAITAAETGHLVLATLHTSTAALTVDRVIDAFPPGQQNQIRQMLADSLKGVIAQTLLPRRDGKGRVAAFEILRNTPNISGLIREAKGHQIPSAIQTGSASGMQTMDGAMLRLVEDGLADPRTAYDHAIRKDLFEPFLDAEGGAA
ncbi:MAG: PilT/PilU family type 4a pilus ATPase [Thermoanaerobaculia bacterium]